MNSNTITDYFTRVWELDPSAPVIFDRQPLLRDVDKPDEQRLEFQSKELQGEVAAHTIGRSNIDSNLTTTVPSGNEYSSRMLIVDLDGTPRNEHWRALRRAPLVPSAVVSYEGGIQLLWKVATPMRAAIRQVMQQGVNDYFDVPHSEDPHKCLIPSLDHISQIGYRLAYSPIRFDIFYPDLVHTIDMLLDRFQIGLTLDLQGDL